MHIASNAGLLCPRYCEGEDWADLEDALASRAATAAGAPLTPDAVTWAVQAVAQAGGATIDAPALAAAAEAVCASGEAATLQWFLRKYVVFKQNPPLACATALCLGGGSTGGRALVRDVVGPSLANLHQGGATSDAWFGTMQEAKLHAELSIEDASEALAPFADDGGRVTGADVLEFIQQHASVDLEHLVLQALTTTTPLQELVVSVS